MELYPECPGGGHSFGGEVGEVWWCGAGGEGTRPKCEKRGKAAAGRGRGAVNDARDMEREKYSERL